MTSKTTADLNLDPNVLYFIPLGGSEQFGVNFNLYGYGGKWLIADCGIGFTDDRYFPGVEILLPDPAFIEARREDLVALIVTHAHEDHVGAVPYLWPRLKCPVYATKFTATVLRNKLSDHPNSKSMPIHELTASVPVALSPFTVTPLAVSHSIPEAVSLLIETPAGRAIHTGDWNLDPSPIVGWTTDEAAFRKAGDLGVLAVIGDSTNAQVPGRTGTESTVEAGLAEVIKDCPRLVAVTMFASNIGRILSIVRAARDCGRKVVLLGRSLHSMVGAARACGYLGEIPPFLEERDLDSIAPEKALLIVTGSQGETNAQLSRIARGEHRSVRLGRGDTVIFSSREIPGNEVDINAVKNNLTGAGVRVICPIDTPHRIHISGHPYRSEMKELLEWVHPVAVVPVHGERTQLESHAALAREMGISSVLVPQNGSVIALTPEGVHTAGHVPVGLLAVEPKRIVPSHHEGLSARRKLRFAGAAHVTLVLDQFGNRLAPPRVTTLGLVDASHPGEDRIEEDLVGETEDILVDLDRDVLAVDAEVAEHVRVGVRRHINALLGMKPKVTVHVVRV